MNIKNTIVLLVLLLAVASSVQAGGPWPQKKGDGYFKLSEWWIVFDQHYTDVGLLDPNVTTGIYNTAFYGEYGFTDRLTGILYAPLLSRNYMNNLVSATTGETVVAGEAVNALGDIDIAVKYGLTKTGSKVPVSATLLLGIPSGQTAAGAQENLQTGDGEFNQYLRLDAGTSFRLGKNISSYASTYAGVNNRTNEFSEEFRFGVEWGAGFLKEKLWLISRLDAVESFKNGATAETITSTSIFANNSEFTSFGLEAAFYITKNIGVSAGFASAFRGEIIAAAPSYTVGVFYDMSK